MVKIYLMRNPLVQRDRGALIYPLKTEGVFQSRVVRDVLQVSTTRESYLRRKTYSTNSQANTGTIKGRFYVTGIDVHLIN